MMTTTMTLMIMTMMIQPMTITMTTMKIMVKIMMTTLTLMTVKIINEDFSNTGSQHTPILVFKCMTSSRPT